MTFDTQKGPVWISHRGHKGRAIENTLSSFNGAIAAGFNVFETDLRVTRDGHIVLLHDKDLWRVAGVPKDVADLTRADLNGIELIDGGSLLFFDEFLEAFADCHWVFDIKPEAGFEVLRQLDSYLSAKKLHSWFASQAKFLMWSRVQEALLVKMLGDVPRYAKKSECWRSGLALIMDVPWASGIVPGRTYSLLPTLGPLSLFQRKFVEQIHNRGGRALAYLPQSEAQSSAALAAGFDEILTDGLPVTP